VMMCAVEGRWTWLRLTFAR